LKGISGTTPVVVYCGSTLVPPYW